MTVEATDQRAAVVVAMLTYRRPEFLDAVLGLLVVQAGRAVHHVEILVVDHDPAGGASAAVGGWAAHGVRYVHEPRAGIAAARNRALDAAAAADLLVFIDDDELPQPNWLDELLGSWSQWRCAAVTGPVLPLFDDPPEPWIAESQAFDRRTLPTGHAVRGAATNNLLLDLETVRSLGLRFDENFGLTGGEDTMFTHALVRSGEEIRWCDEAEVLGRVPASRARKGYVLQRKFREGTSWSRIGLMLAPGRAARVVCRATLLGRGCGRLTKGALRWGWGVGPGGLSARAGGSCDICTAGGMLLGAVGYLHPQYRRHADG